MGWLAGYLIFVAIVLAVVAYLVVKLKVRAPVLTVMALLIIIISPVILSYLYLIYIAPLPEAVVPDLTWLTVDEADVRLSTLGLRARVAERVYERDVPDGRIISQRPEGGRRVKKGRVINLIVSIGKRKVSVPNLVGRPFSQVSIVLDEAGLRVGEKTSEHSEQYQTGVVSAQNPLPDASVDIGTRVDVVIAENPKFGIVKMPNLAGMPLIDAQDILHDLKLNAIIFYHETMLFEEGMVVSHDPISNTELEMGARVRVYVSIPPSDKAAEPDTGDL